MNYICSVMLVAKRRGWALDVPLLHHILSFVAFGWLDSQQKIS